MDTIITISATVDSGQPGDHGIPSMYS
ncbi:unnamed protein product, partial [Rotaria sp. Silwood1]